MIRNADLFTIATSGLQAQNQLLTTTSNNIANVNTQGFVRERTEHTEQIAGGVGIGSTSRVINTFAQNQHRRDTSRLGEAEILSERTNQVDNIFASESNSAATTMSRFFAALGTSTDEPNNTAARQLVIGEAQTTVGQFATLGGFLEETQEELTLELTSLVNRANNLIQSIAELNTEIRVTAQSSTEPGALLNQRDQAILELSELVGLETRDGGDRATFVNLTSGQSLVLEDGSFNFFEVAGDPDLTRGNLSLVTSGNTVTIPLPDPDVGGQIGGLIQFRDEVVETSQRELGQIALALGDSFNQQNRLGLDQDGQLGSDIFSLPNFSGLPYQANPNPNLNVNARVTDGGANTLTSADYQITVNAVNPGAPNTLDITVALLNPDGTAVTDTGGTPITQTLLGVTAAAGTFTPINGGLDLEFPDGATYSVNDQFLIQPTKQAAQNLGVAITRPEDLALASPVRVESSINNLGDAAVVATTVTNTTVDATFGNGASAFDGAGGIHGPGASPTGGGGVGAPARIVFTAADSYQVQDSAGTVITTVAGATDLNNLINQASGTAGWPAAFGALGDYPGYDLSIQGTPRAGDTFDINYNTNGTDDNRNGLLLTGLQDADSMLRSNNSGATTGNLISFHEAYSAIVSDIGEASSSAEISLNAARALEQQSSDFFESTAGVSLDEEAANLVRFQQAYSASARILSTAQSLFDTILSAVR